MFTLACWPSKSRPDYQLVSLVLHFLKLNCNNVGQVSKYKVNCTCPRKQKEISIECVTWLHEAKTYILMVGFLYFFNLILKHHCLNDCVRHKIWLNNILFLFFISFCINVQDYSIVILHKYPMKVKHPSTGPVLIDQYHITSLMLYLITHNIS